MEPATTEDLIRASTQGTIMAINVDGKVYGEGYIAITTAPVEKSLWTLGVFGRCWYDRLLATTKATIVAIRP